MNPAKLSQPSILSIAYAAIFLMLLLAGWNPSLRLGPGPIDLLLLLDESGSIDPAHNDAVWHSFLRQAGSLPAGSRIGLMRFSDRAVMEVPWLSTRDNGFVTLSRDASPPRHRLLDRNATAIAPALVAAMRLVNPQRHTALIISSDGIDSVTPKQTVSPVDITDADNNPKLSLFYLDATGESRRPALRIESINTPPVSTPGLSLPLSIAIDSVHGGQGTIEILLNDRIVNSQEVALEPGEKRVLHLQPSATQSGVQVLEFIARNRDGRVLERRIRVVPNRDDRELLYIGNHVSGSLSRSLSVDNWRIVQLEPGRLPVEDAFFNRFGAILLDDIAADAIDADITGQLIDAVKRNGTGLLVLGGPHSYGSGGYRHSGLESVLPVTSESSRPLPGAAFVFLVDKSGSMEAANRANSRLADALEAVAESAKSLRPGDESALLAFDRDVEVLLPLERRADAVTMLGQPWRLQPSGGTQLAPALERAIELFARSDSQRRFLILVTDGFVDAENIGPLIQALQQEDIRLIALGIGENADLSTLQSLAAVNNGRVLRIDDTAELPRFMRHELETEQHSWNNASLTPRTLRPAPFISERTSAWRELHGYQVTRARPSASVYVTTEDGDPLLATGQAGAGRVAALPGGLLEPLDGDQLLGGLLSWLHSRGQNPNLEVSHRYVSGRLTLVVDAVDADNEWQPATSAQVTLTTPGGITSATHLQAVAPGQYSGVINAPEIGVYHANIEVGNERTRYSAWVANDSESEHHTTVPWLRRARTNGEIRRWTQAELDDLLASSSGRIATRTFWLLLALSCYLALIAYERSGALRVLKNNLLPRHANKPPDRNRAGTRDEF